jgi:hypothetical protein
VKRIGGLSPVSSRSAFALCAALLLRALPAGAAVPPGSSQREDDAAVTRAEQALAAGRDRLALVEREYGQPEDPSELLRLRKSFSDGETQYLLGEYANAAALLYDVVDAPAFRNEESYPDALVYLADSLYHTQSWLEARRYYRELLAQKPGKYQQESLLRMIELSDRTSDWSGIDGNWENLLRAGLQLKPELVYLHAKWLARRPDLADADRIGRALAAFGQIPAASEYGPQSRYFEGALLVQRGALDGAVKTFEGLLALKAPAAEDTRAARIRDQAHLAIGRIFFEQGRYGPAIDHYQSIAKDSDAYNDALYELSASWLKLGELEKALRTTGLLLLLVEDSAAAPEARLLEANLQLRLKQYVKAQKQFAAIADQYRPVREQIAALIERKDPVSYYDDLLQRGDKSLDATQLLPEVARKYVSGRDVGEARVIIDELQAGRAGIEESQEIVRRLEAALEDGKLDLFPTLQEGNARAVEVENALLRVDAQLAAVEGNVVLRQAPALQGPLDEARAARQRVEARAAGALPATHAQVEARRKAALGRVAALEKAASKLALDLQSIAAQLQAAQQWRARTEAARKAPPQVEQEFAAQVERDRAAVMGMEQQRLEAARQLELARAAAVAEASGSRTDDALREELLSAVRKEAAAAQATQASLPPLEQALFARAAAASASIPALRERAQKVREQIRQQAAARLLLLRGRLERERNQIADYRKTAAGLQGGTRQLLGRIAFDSFARVERQFYDLILKADVGVVDAAWTQKKERTEAITALESERRGQLKALQDEFSEVLRAAE